MIYVCVLVTIDLTVFITTLSYPELRPQAFLYPSSEQDVDSNVCNLLFQNGMYFVEIGC